MDGEPKLIKPLLVGMHDAATLLDCGIDHVYSLIDAEEIDSFLEGTRRKITVGSIEALIARRLAAKRGKLDRSALLSKRLAVGHRRKATPQ
jgi:hypothetical protein